MQAVSRDTYQDEVVAASHEQPVLVDFWGPRCGPCLKMEPWVESVAQESAGVLKVVKLNSAENRRLCVELRVLGLPTFLLYRDGLEIRRLTGDGCTPATIAQALREDVPELASRAALTSIA
jgi:thioredoxin 1